MLARPATAAALARLRSHPGLRDAWWVIDPVLRSSSGAELLAGGAAGYAPLLEGAVITPNLDEVAQLLDVPVPTSREEMEEAGRALLARGVAEALVKGGHLEGEPVDLLVVPEGTHVLRGRRRPGTRRGTGCRLATHVAAQLARGAYLPAAAAAAKAYVAAYLYERAS